MLNSKIKKRRIDEEMRIQNDSTSSDNTNSEVQEVSDEYSRDTEVNFNHKSYLKLRNLFHLLILLKTQPFLRDHRAHRLCDKSRYDTDKNESFFDSFDRQKRRFKKPGKFNKTNTRLFFMEAQAQEVQIQKNLAEISHIQAANNNNNNNDVNVSRLSA